MNEKKIIILIKKNFQLKKMLNNRISLKENELNDSEKIINKLQKENKNNITPILF